MRLHRLLAGPVIAGLMVLAQTLTVGSASAAVTDPACNYDFVHFDACLYFTGSGELNVLIAHAGLDERMAQASAQEIVASPGSVWGSLWADDGGNGRDHWIADLSVDPGWPAAGTDGLGVELSAPCPSTTSTKTPPPAMTTRSTPASSSTTATATSWNAEPEPCTATSARSSSRPTAQRPAAVPPMN
jgi:hypothetical protein